jgi:glycosyltransferase involved in cell wall biosynthesis
MEAIAGAPRVYSVGLGTEVPAQPLSPTGHDPPGALYIGGFNHPPNSDAAMRLVRTIMPNARQRIPGTRLVIVGSNPGPELQRAATPDDVVTGWVPSVTPYLDEAAVVVLPIRLGGGMRVKLLEALAAGKAVVASPLAAAGLEVTSGEQLVLAESDAEFADALARLLREPADRARIAGNARRWAQKYLGWEARVGRYEEIYAGLLGRQPAAEKTRQRT